MRTGMTGTATESPIIVTETGTAATTDKTSAR
jgi:hypothetical protein